jgi:hypothetical protein
MRAEWREPQGREPGYWRVTVDWERGWPYEPWPHRADELEPTGAHQEESGR